MQQEDRNQVSEVIRNNTRRVTLADLAKDGKQHVRVISGQKTLELIETIVDATIARRAGELAADLTEQDRARIIQEAEEQFGRVSRMQADAEALVRQQTGLLTSQGERIEKLESRLKRAAGSLRRRERRLANATMTIENYDREIERLAAQVRKDAEVIDEMRAALTEARATEGLDAVRGELVELKSHLVALQDGNADRASEMENRFDQSMQRTLDNISKTLHAATARPQDRPVEATDALMSRIFDQDGEMESNLSRLDVNVSSTRAGIDKSLARLKRLREENQGDETMEDRP